MRMIKSHQRDTPLAHDCARPMTEKVATIDLDDIGFDVHQQLLELTNVRYDAMVRIIHKPRAAYRVHGRTKKPVSRVCGTGDNNRMGVRTTIVGKVAGFFRQIGIDTTFTPIDVECREITDMHADKLEPPGSVSNYELPRLPGDIGCSAVDQGLQGIDKVSVAFQICTSWD